MKKFSLLAICLLAFSVNASAQYSAFKDAVVADFSKEEMATFRSTISEALNSTESPITKKWDSKTSDAGGTVTAGEMFTKSIKGEDLPCRKIETNNHARGQSGKQINTYCKIKDGSWKIAS